MHETITAFFKATKNGKSQAGGCTESFFLNFIIYTG